MSGQNISVNYNDTGEKALETIGAPYKNINVVVLAGGSDVYDIDLQLGKNLTRFPHLTALSGNTSIHLESPVEEVGLDITTNTSGSITLEISNS